MHPGFPFNELIPFDSGARQSDKRCELVLSKQSQVDHPQPTPDSERP